MNQPEDNPTEIERRWAAIRAAKEAKSVRTRIANQNLVTEELDAVLGDTKGGITDWERRKRTEAKERTMREKAPSQGTCKIHGTPLGGLSGKRCYQCKPGVKGAKTQAKPAVDHPWRKAKAIKVEPEPVNGHGHGNGRAAEPTILNGHADDQVDAMADALNAIRRLSPSGRRALVMILGE